MHVNDNRLRPLITAEEAFPAMETLVLSAVERLDLSLHVFSPRTKTRSAGAHREHLSDWGQLIADALARDIHIRFLLNDFDPVGAPEMHATVWERMAALSQILSGLPDGKRDNLEMLVVHPGGQTGAIVRALVWPATRSKQHEAVTEFEKAGRRLPPGLAAGHDIPVWPPRPNFTQTLHQKFLIADGSRAVLGGLDIDERRYDEPEHRREAEETWHDVSVEVEGPAATHLQAHFDLCWRRARSDGSSHASRFQRLVPGQAIRFVSTGVRRRTTANADTTAGSGAVAIATTLPRPGRNPFRFGPSADVRELERAHLELFGDARHLIYLETQFLRSSVIRDGLVAALGEHDGLHVILLLPGAPEAVAFKGEHSGVQRYGEWLQTRAINRLVRLFPDRFAAFSLTSERDREENVERDAIEGKSMVYIHSKVAIADDRKAIVSSANLNGRSMQWDVEAGIVAEDAAFAGTLRRQLWHAHLGSEAAAIPSPVENAQAAFEHWRESAQERRAAGAAAKGTGIVPFPLGKARRFAKRHLFIPEQMV